MAVLTPEMKEILSQQLGIVGTVGRDGKPNLAPKGTLRVLDDSTLVFAEIAGQTTYQNILANPVVAVAAVDRANRKMFRCVGRAELVTSGALFEGMAGQVEARGLPRPEAVVKVVVEEVREVKV